MSFPTTDPSRPTWLHASHSSTSWSPEVSRSYHIALSYHRQVQSSLSRSRPVSSPYSSQAQRSAASTTRNVPLTAVQSEALNAVAAHRHARGDHIPSRGPPSEWSRLARALKGFPPVGTAQDADSLSDEEVAHEAVRDQVANYGERHIVQLGRAKTRYEEELSADDIVEARPRLASPGGSMEAMGATTGMGTGTGTGTDTMGDEEAPAGAGQGGRMRGMHTGQAAQVAAATAAAATAGGFGRGSDVGERMIRGETDLEGGDTTGTIEREGEGDDEVRDLDASVEDLDVGREASLR